MKKFRTFLLTLLIVATLAVSGYAASNDVVTAADDMTTLLRGSPPVATGISADNVSINIDRVNEATTIQQLPIANLSARHSLNAKAAYAYDVQDNLSLIVSNTDVNYMETIPTITLNIRFNPPPLTASTNAATTANNHDATARGPSNKVAMTTTDADNAPTLATARGSTGNVIVTVTDNSTGTNSAHDAMDNGRTADD